MDHIDWNIGPYVRRMKEDGLKGNENVTMDVWGDKSKNES